MLQPLAADVALAAGLQRVLEQRVHVHRLVVQFQLAAGDAREVEQVVDQLRFQLDVAPDDVRCPRDTGGQLRSCASPSPS
jgi:hypothetical protein